MDWVPHAEPQEPQVLWKENSLYVYVYYDL